MFFFGNSQKKLRKQCRHLLGHAHKVVCYRKDQLSEAALAEIEGARAPLELALTEKRDAKTLEAEQSKLDKVLRKHGGKIYPITFGSENVEMIIVAAILAIGVRTYFIQPFKIPTNSMWPTYAGLNATVYPPEDPRPSLPKRAFLGLTQGLPQSLPFVFGEFNYYITAPNDGELVFPVLVSDRSDLGLGLVPKPLYETYEEPTLGKLVPSIKSQKRRYKVLVGGQVIEIDAPGDFEMEDVVAQSWFPEYEDFSAAFEAYRAMGKVERSQNANVMLIRTGKMLKTGDTVLDFDINSGDMLFVDRFSYNFIQPDVGDPIVFRTQNIPGLRHQNSLGQLVPDELYYIKRLVGKAGDELKVEGNTLFSNGEPITGADAFDKNAQKIEGYAGYRPYLRLADGKSETIVPGYFYAMGDNSPHSSDSRFWGYRTDDIVRTPAEKEAGVPANMVPEKDVIGRAAFIFYPLSYRWGPAE